MFVIRLRGAVIFTALFLLSCSSDQIRINKAFDLAKKNHYQASIIHTSIFPIQIFYQAHKSKHAIIYLEGDGLVINKYGEVAMNSTPTDPIALRLACADDRKLTKIVIHRPYHYIKDPNANSRYWTTARYAPEVIKSIAETIKNCQQQFSFSTMELVAYSGGASVALLLAPHLQNLQRITSFAGNLDHKDWTSYHNTNPLFESLDPLENKKILGEISQIHFLGTNDANTTVDLGLKYKQNINSDRVVITPIDGFEHDSDWPSVWKKQIVKMG